MQLFTTNGMFISSFGSRGSLHGQLYKPNGVSVDSSYTVYVTDENHRVSVYNSTGHFIKSFSTNGLDSPIGVAVDNTTGALYVCDWGNNRVVVY